MDDDHFTTSRPLLKRKYVNLIDDNHMLIHELLSSPSLENPPSKPSYEQSKLGLIQATQQKWIESSNNSDKPLKQSEPLLLMLDRNRNASQSEAEPITGSLREQKSKSRIELHNSNISMKQMLQNERAGSTQPNIASVEERSPLLSSSSFWCRASVRAMSTDGSIMESKLERNYEITPDTLVKEQHTNFIDKTEEHGKWLYQLSGCREEDGRGATNINVTAKIRLSLSPNYAKNNGTLLDSSNLPLDTSTSPRQNENINQNLPISSPPNPQNQQKPFNHDHHQQRQQPKKWHHEQLQQERLDQEQQQYKEVKQIQQQQEQQKQQQQQLHEKQESQNQIIQEQQQIQLTLPQQQLHREQTKRETEQMSQEQRSKTHTENILQETQQQLQKLPLYQRIESQTDNQILLDAPSTTVLDLMKMSSPEKESSALVGNFEVQMDAGVICLTDTESLEKSYKCTSGTRMQIEHLRRAVNIICHDLTEIQEGILHHNFAPCAVICDHIRLVSAILSKLIAQLEYNPNEKDLWKAYESLIRVLDEVKIFPSKILLHLVELGFYIFEVGCLLGEQVLPSCFAPQVHAIQARIHRLSAGRVVRQIIYVPKSFDSIITTHYKDRRLGRIEHFCACKVRLLNRSHPRTVYCPPDYRTLEVNYDPVRGKYIGFLELLNRSIGSNRCSARIATTVMRRANGTELEVRAYDLLQSNSVKPRPRLSDIQTELCTGPKQNTDLTRVAFDMEILPKSVKPL